MLVGAAKLPSGPSSASGAAGVAANTVGAGARHDWQSQATPSCSSPDAEARTDGSSSALFAATAPPSDAQSIIADPGSAARLEINGSKAAHARHHTVTSAVRVRRARVQHAGRRIGVSKVASQRGGRTHKRGRRSRPLDARRADHRRNATPHQAISTKPKGHAP